jgi:hypothetical protein
VLSRAADYLEPYRPAKDGIDVDALAAALREAAEACRSALDGGGPPQLRMVKLHLGGR